MNDNTNNIPMIGSTTPRFVATSTVGPVKITDYIGQWVIFFSINADFTPICTTEMMYFSKYGDEFNKRNANLLCLSTDSNPSNLAWIRDIEQNTGTQVTFPVISDMDKNIANIYGMIPNTSENGELTRNVFFIDPTQRIRCIFIYPIENGRNILEILRILDAMQATDTDGSLTPANWSMGGSRISKSPQSYVQLLDNIRSNNSKNCIDWYLRLNNELRR